MDKKIKNISDAVADGWAESAMKVKLNALEQEKAHYQLKLKEIQLSIKSQAPKQDDVIEIIRSSKVMLDGSEEDKRQVIRTFVEKVIVYDDGKVKINSVLDITGHALSPPVIK